MEDFKENRLAILLMDKVLEGDDSLYNRRLKTKELLESFNLWPIERDTLKHYCELGGYLSVATIAVVFG